MDKPLEFELTLAEANQILDALGQQPYANVYELVSNIQSQASRQIQARDEQKDDNPPAQVVAK